MSRRSLLTAAVVAAVLGIGLLVLQRWVAETRGAAIALVAAWFALVGVAILALGRSRPWARRAALATYAAIALGSVAIGWWTGFRDEVIDEDVAMAARAAGRVDAEAGLRGDERRADERDGPGFVSLARGTFTGRDGHAAKGTATVVEGAGGERRLTFTGFDVDPGVQVEVWLTPDPEETEDRVELGGLKGNVGDQQYAVPAGADLTRYDTVVLYCVPFTVRIATAELA